MRLRTLLTSCAVLAALAVAPAGAITYGSADGNGHPNVGALLGKFGNEFLQVCSGTLIAPTVFVTASHCTIFLQEEGADAYVTFDSDWDDNLANAIPGFIHVNDAYSTSPGFAHSPDVAVITFASGAAVLAACGCTPALLPGAGLLDQMAAQNGLKRQEFVAVGYGVSERTKSGQGAPQFTDTTLRGVATGTFRSLGPNWLHLSQNPAIDDGGTCYGDSGGPNFLGNTQVIAALTVTGDRYCRATNVTFRLDTPAARSFLADFVALP